MRKPESVEEMPKDTIENSDGYLNDEELAEHF